LKKALKAGARGLAQDPKHLESNKGCNRAVKNLIISHEEVAMNEVETDDIVLDDAVPELEAPPTFPTTLGIIGMIAWIIPIIGLPIAIIGLLKALKYRAKYPTHYSGAIVLCTIALFLSIVNAGIGAYMGATGQHSLVNRLRGE
jgi:hypothetical protein